MTVKPWTITANPSGFVYIVDGAGNKICTIYGTNEQKILRATAIAQLPVLVDHLRRKTA